WVCKLPDASAMTPPHAKKIAAGLAMLIAAAASLATSKACDNETSLHDSAHLDATQASVTRKFRISAPGPTHPRVKLMASGGSVRVSLASVDAPPTGAETGSMSATTDATGSATIDLADCAGSVRPSYGVA